MSDYNISRDKLNARTDERHRLGTDAADRDHYLDQQLSAIWVVDGDDIVHVLGQLANVAATEVRAPDVTSSDSFELEIVLGKAAVGPLLLDVLSARRLHVVDVSRRGDPTHCIVRARP